MPGLPLPHRDLAPWWPLLSAPEEYAAEAERCWHEDGSVTTARDRRVLGLFSRADWLRPGPAADDAGGARPGSGPPGSCLP